MGNLSSINDLFVVLLLHHPPIPVCGRPMSDLYVQAAVVLDGVLSQSGSLKGLVMTRAKATRSDAKRLLALTANTLAFLKPLQTALEQANLLKLEKKAFQGAAVKGCSSRSLALVVVHDLLLTKRGRVATSPAWPPHGAVVRHAARLKAELVKLQIQQGKASIHDLRAGEATKKRAERIPRWVRVNERLTTVKEVIGQLDKEGWRQVEAGSHLSAKSRTFACSPHIPSVLATHSAHTSLLLGHPLYDKGHLILQDLASCFPGEILLGSVHASTKAVHALDATSAPGNKTSHLSAKLAHAPIGSRVTALEHSKPRYETLLAQLRRAGAFDGSKPGKVRAILGDFTKEDPSRYADVTHMLLDPSCSGSGILGRLDYLTEEQDEETTNGAGQASTQQSERLKGLSAFQSTMIDHAMHFPALCRLVYSTCSVHHEENEDVVVRALASEVAQRRGWTLATRKEVIPSWQSRGIEEHCGQDEVLAQGMVRCVPGGEGIEAACDGPDLDATNGFFVACFVRENGVEGNEEKEQEKKGNNTEKNRKRKQRLKEKARAAKRIKCEQNEV